MPAGAPTKYRKKYCKEIIKFMSKGKSLVQFAASIDCGKETVYGWARDIPEFSDAFNVARAKCEAKWEEIAQSKTVKKSEGSDGVLIFYLKNRFGWTDRQFVPKEATKIQITDANPNTGPRPQVIVTIPSNGRESDGDENE